ncbi:MAG: hypothetical protein ABIB11_02970 [Candidatus Omnitrophota bacterium]
MINFLYTFFILPLLNERGIGGGGDGGDSTTVIQQPEQTAEERQLQLRQNELIQAQIEEARRQSEMLERFGPMYEEQLKQQSALAQQQMESQQKAYDQLSQALQPTETELRNQEIEQALLERQLGYAQGEMPTLSESEQKNLDEMIGIQKQQMGQDILKSYQQGLMASKQGALARGLGSSSIRERQDDLLGAQLMGQAGEASRQLEGARYQAAWQLPQSKQILETSTSQFQQSLNQQAESNRQRFYGSLTTPVGSPFEPLGSLMNMSVPGTYFGYNNDAGRSLGSGQGKSAEDRFQEAGAMGTLAAGSMDPSGGISTLINYKFLQGQGWGTDKIDNDFGISL